MCQLHCIKNRSCFFILILLVCINICNGQTKITEPSKYYVQHFGEEEGLPQNSITCILPDKNDFLWIGTEAGITMFNGKHFFSVQMKTDEIKNSLTRIKSLHYKGSDTILAYSDQSLSAAVIVNGKIISIEEQKVERQGLLFENQHYAIPAPVYIKGSNFSPSSIGMENWEYAKSGYLGGEYKKDTFLVMLHNAIGVYNSKGMINKIKIDTVLRNKALFVNKQIIYIDEEDQINSYNILSGLRKRYNCHFHSATTIFFSKTIFSKTFISYQNHLCIA